MTKEEFLEIQSEVLSGGMVKTEQTVTAKTAMLLQFWRGKVIVFFLNYLLSMQISMRYLQLYPR